MITASADPEVAEVLDRNKRQRFETFDTIMGEISGKAGFDPQLPVRRAVETLYAILSEETYGLLVVEHGWNVREWTEWAARTVGREFFPRS